MEYADKGDLYLLNPSENNSLNINVKNRYITIVKEENSLPSLNKIDLNPIVPSSRNPNRIIGLKKNHLKELHKYLNSLVDRSKVYVPHLYYSYNSNGNKHKR